MKVKICGITNIKDALLCESRGADALGFIFHKESKRYIEPQKVKKIIDRLSPFTMKVGVFVNETSEFINSTANQLKLNAVQLHGNETFDFLNYINVPVIKSFRINNNFNVDLISEYKNCHLLFDSFSEYSLGGTGKTFNWKLIPRGIMDKAILSGGISITNIKEIINKIRPKAIDISSSLEISPGKKNEQKVKEFFSVLDNLRNKKC